MNLLDAFHAQVDAHPDRTAIVDPKGRAISYAALDARAQGLAAHWNAAGLRRGDRVLLALGFSADLYAALAALWRLGAAAVLPEPALGLAGIRHAVEATSPRALLLDGLYRLLPLAVPALRRAELRLSLRTGAGDPPPVADLAPEEAALISFTTGSTGRPKAIVRSHGFMRAQDTAVAPLIATHGKAEVDLVGFPVFVVANLGQGITSILPDWPVRQTEKASGEGIARLIDRHGVTRLLLNPALVERLAGHGIPSGVHSVFTGGGPVFPDVIECLRHARPDLRVCAVYGSTEAEPIAEIDAADIAPEDFAAMAAGGGLLAGHPVACAHVRIVDSEIQVSGDHVVCGYLDPSDDHLAKIREPDGTVWHRTGDAGRFDDRGRLWLLGRQAGRIGGLWPFPIEIAARTWPGIHRAALADWQGEPLLALEGDPRHSRDWQARAASLGIDRVIAIKAMPMDRRHASKIDAKRLRALVDKRLKDRTSRFVDHPIGRIPKS